MKEILVTFETSKLARESGFSVPCRGRIHSSHYHLVKDNIIPPNVPIHHYEMFAPIEDWNNLSEQDPNDKKEKLVGLNLSLPTQSLLQKWLREVHKIEVNISSTCSQINNAHGYNFYIWNKNTGYEFWSEPDNCPTGEFSHDTYEEALEKGLQEALKLI